jgi:hypothetical protein
MMKLFQFFIIEFAKARRCEDYELNVMVHARGNISNTFLNIIIVWENSRV